MQLNGCSFLGERAGQMDCGCDASEPDVGIYACNCDRRRVDHCVQIGFPDSEPRLQDVILRGGVRRKIAVQCCHHCPLRTPAEPTSTLPKPKGFEGRRKQGQTIHGKNAVAEALGPADVLIAIGNTNPAPAWREIRGDFVADLLNAHNLSAKVIQLGRGDAAAFMAAVEQTGCRLVINRAFAVDVAIVERAATLLPHCKFVTVNHSSNTWTASVAGWVSAQHRFAQLAIERQNCFYATVSERDAFRDLIDTPRAIWLPNVVRIPLRKTPQLGQELEGDVVLSLVARFDSLKALGPQILGAALAAKRMASKRELRMRLSVSRPGADFETLAKDVGLRLSVAPWGSWKEYTTRIAAECHVGLQVTCSDSFNYVALEHMACGLPTVTSWPIRYGLPELREHSEDVYGIATAIETAIDRFADYSTRSAEVAEKVAKHCNHSFAERVQEIIGG